MSDDSRKYLSSSSFKMAVLFAFLLGISGLTLIYFIYSYGQGRQINEYEVAISTDTYNLILWLGVISIISMSAVVIISFLISTFVVTRINLIGKTAKEIMDTGDLSRRISIDSQWDDLSNLAIILNNLLSRIEILMEDVRRVSDNIAHDLRTPLTRLRNNLENLNKLREKPSEDQVNELINEADGLLHTFNALLRITNIEKGKRSSGFSKYDLKIILNDVLELYEPIIEEKNIKLFTNLERVTYRCDRDLVFQSIANLLDNAIKFTSQKGNIWLNLRKEDKIIIELKDDGVGISEKNKDKIFDRFFRADESRNKPGSGLGLSLVNAVVKLHNGKIEVQDNIPQGLSISIIF